MDIERRMMRIPFLALALILAALGAAAPVFGASAYHLGPEDVVVVTVLRHPEFSGTFLIPSDGNLDLPGVGQIKSAGMTPQELQAEIAGRLGERLVRPEVTVSLHAVRQQRVYVLGAVKQPGVYDHKTGWRITELLAAAGGAEGEPSDCTVSLLRASTGKQEMVDLTGVMRADPEANLVLEPGDVLTVQAVEHYPIYVMGRVKNPGMYRMRGDNTGLIASLTLAGGTLVDAALSRVSVTHVDGTIEIVDTTHSIVEGKSENEFKLRPGDLVVVPESTARIAVLGTVREPGYFPLRDGHKTMLSDAIGLARGVDTRQGNLGSVMVLRNAGGKQEKLIYDMGKFLTSGDVDHNPEVQPGDVIFVPRNRGTNWDVVIRMLGSFSLLFNSIGLND